jgi:hypothetical protein
VTEAAASAEVRTRVRAVPSELGVLTVLGAFTLFALNFGAYRVFGDGVNYYSFTQRLFGDTSRATAYNFGAGLMNAPFYGAAKLTAPFSTDPRIGPASITLASIAWALTAVVLSWRILVRLGLPCRAPALAAAALGTPVWYYASFSPSYTHAADAAAFSAAAWGALGIWSSNALGWRLGTGAALALAVAVRPFNLGVAAGLVVALAAQRRLRDALATGGSAVVAFAALWALPLSLGLTETSLADGAPSIRPSSLRFSPLTPVRMLVTDHRGLFLWTPATFLAVVGLALLLRRRRQRGFLVTLAAMGGGLLLMYVASTDWDAGWSYSARYLAAPVALYAVGIAGLLGATRGAAHTVAVAATVACTAWALVVGMNHAFGASQRDGAFQVATIRSPRVFAERAWAYSRVRHVVDVVDWR